MPFNKLLEVDTLGYKNHKTLIYSTSIVNCKMNNGQIVVSTAVLLLAFHHSKM